MTVKQYLDALGYTSDDVDANIRAALSELFARRSLSPCPSCQAPLDDIILLPAQRLALQTGRPG